MIEIEESGFNDPDWKPAPPAGTGTGEPQAEMREEAERHHPDEKRGGCTCGFCAWSVDHVQAMLWQAVVQPALEAKQRGYDVLVETADVLKCPREIYPPEHAHSVMAQLDAANRALAAVREVAGRFCRLGYGSASDYDKGGLRCAQAIVATLAASPNPEQGRTEQ